MEVRQVQGKDMRDALERTRDQLGDRAVVVSHRRGADGRILLAVSEEVPRSVQALAALRAEAQAVLARDPDRSLGASGLADVERRMRRSGCSGALVEAVLEASAARLQEDRHPLDVAADVIAERFPIARARSRPGVTPVMAFLGPTGVGKTTTIAKLARRFVRAGRRVALASLDGSKPVDALGAYAVVLRVPCLDGGVSAWSARRRDLDALLLDTAGEVARDVERLAAIAARAAEGDLGLRVDAYLVLSATSSTAALEELGRAARPLRPAGCVITKLDETPLRAPILELALELGAPIAFLSDGATYQGRFHRATGECFADLCLRGRLS